MSSPPAVVARPFLCSSALRAAALPLGLVAALAGCSPEERAFVAPCTPETQAIDCQDDNPCTADACAGGVCAHVPLDGVSAPPSAQVEGDCRVITCVAGRPSNEVDDADVPAGGGACTTAVCRDGSPVNVATEGAGCCVDDADCPPCHVCGGDGACRQAEDGASVPGCERPCDEPGACEAPDGAECSLPRGCASGNCVDGVCCDTACGETCMACNVEGAVGTCSLVALEDEDAPTCQGSHVCDGAGACRLAPGEPCTDDADCASDFCLPVDGSICAPSDWYEEP